MEEQDMDNIISKTWERNDKQINDDEKLKNEQRNLFRFMRHSVREMMKSENPDDVGLKTIIRK